MEYKPSISHMKPGVYLFEFNSKEDQVVVLSRNWTFYHKSQISLKAWEPDIDVEKLNFVSAPVWIQLPNLKWRFWTHQGLSKLASYVGLPIAMDKLTTSRARLGYARILVEVNLKRDLSSTIPITDPNGKVF